MQPTVGIGNLVALKCLLFCFFGGIGCLFPFLPLHMLRVGLSIEEAHIISIVAPFVAILGPLLAGPLADRLGSSSSRNNGCALRIMLAISMLLSAISYSLLLAIPTVEHLNSRRLAVSFSCSPDGAEILQERCMEDSSCYQWTKIKSGPLLLSDCRYDCKPEAKSLSFDGMETTLASSTSDTSQDDNDYDHSGFAPMEVDDYEHQLKRRHAVSLSDDLDPPHLCIRDANGHVLCHVYSNSSEMISINASLLQALNPEASRQDWCKYPLGGNVWCRIPQVLLAPMGHEMCLVVCDLQEPYTTPGSVLAESQCQQVGDPTITFWSYLLVRSVAEIFPTAAITLLNTAIVIATRDTSIGHADIGRQLAFGTFGFATVPLIVGVFTTLNVLNIPEKPVYLFAFVMFVVMMIISSLLVFAQSMSLGAPEWWWSARGSLGATARRYRCELAALFVVLAFLGAFFGAIESYIPWRLSALGASPLYICGMLTVGALPAILLLWNSERVIDYCGHSNLLITAFTFYIIRFTALSLISSVILTLVSEALELFTLSIMWVTAILYVRHLVPRHLTATGQGAAVIGHFCIGRSLGCLFTGVISEWSDSMVLVHHYGAVISALVATVYFILYHCCLKPRCVDPSKGPGRKQSPVVQGGSPTNGSYTPLRVYKTGSEETREPFRY